MTTLAQAYLLGQKFTHSGKTQDLYFTALGKARLSYFLGQENRMDEGIPIVLKVWTYSLGNFEFEWDFLFEPNPASDECIKTRGLSERIFWVISYTQIQSLSD